jgi:hypothetical protein
VYWLPFCLALTAIVPLPTRRLLTDSVGQLDGRPSLSKARKGLTLTLKSIGKVLCL